MHFINAKTILTPHRRRTSRAVPERRTFLSQYWDYYKTDRGYHPRSLNSNMGWVSTASTSLMNTSLLTYSNKIRSAVLIVHGEKADCENSNFIL